MEVEVASEKGVEKASVSVAESEGCAVEGADSKGPASRSKKSRSKRKSKLAHLTMEHQDKEAVR